MSITRDIQHKEKILTGRQQTKMSYWVKKYQFPQSAAFPNNSSNGIVNLSSIPLSEKEERVLALGLHYVPPDKPDIPRLIAGVEGALKNLNHMETLRIRHAVTQVLRRPYHPVSYARDHRSLIQKLRKTSSLVITKADKGNQTVLMDRADYEGKMMNILAETSTFTIISTSAKDALVKGYKSSLRNLMKAKQITKAQLTQFTDSLTRDAYIYGAPKIHKPGVPLRPIIAYHLSPAHTLAKYLAQLLSPIMKNNPNQYNITHPPSFVQEITQMQLPAQHTMVSFDVTALYLSLPHALILNKLQSFLKSAGIQDQTITLITQLTSLCLSISTFTFNHQYYKQIRGTPMGSPLSSIVAEVVMGSLDQWINQMHSSDIHYWRRNNWWIFPVPLSLSRVEDIVKHSFNVSMYSSPAQKSSSTWQAGEAAQVRDCSVGRSTVPATGVSRYDSNTLQNRPPEVRLALESGKGRMVSFEYDHDQKVSAIVENQAINITSMAKATIYKYHLGLEMGMKYEKINGNDKRKNKVSRDGKRTHSVPLTGQMPCLLGYPGHFIFPFIITLHNSSFHTSSLRKMTKTWKIVKSLFTIQLDKKSPAAVSENELWLREMEKAIRKAEEKEFKRQRRQMERLNLRDNCLFFMEQNQYDGGGGGGGQQTNKKRPRPEDEDLLPSSHNQFKFNSTASLFNFGCRTFEAIIADTSLDTPEKMQMATRGLMLTLVQEAELLLEDAFKGASLGRPNPAANIPIPSTSFASVVAEKEKPVRPALPKPKVKATFVNLAPSFESHVVVKSADPKSNPREILRNFFRGLYRACHNRLKAAIRKAKSKSWFNLCEEVSSASWSAIHRFIARGRGSPRGPPLLKHDNGSPYYPHETCQAVLNYFFLPDTRPHPQRNAISAHSDEPEFKPWEVLRAIHRCGKRKAPGPDGLGSKCLDLGGPSLQFLLAELFTKCLRMGHFPRPWKEGRLILLPKPSNSATSQLEKYRPITLLNTMAKVFERCILARLQWLADRHGWFFEDQYGFVNGRSAEDALASITQFIEERQAHWRKTLVISLDISKAFDTVWRPAIIQNLERLNCPEYITGLVKSFLEDRRVSYSAWTATECTSSQLGTPQGSALSPFLWNIVARTIFTLPSIKDSRLIAYADDFTLMIQVRGRLPVSATNNFLERLTSWCTMCGLNINPSKTQACLFQWRNVHPNSETGLKILGQPLNIKKTITILGVELDQTRGFVAHLRKITRRCRSIIPRLTNSIKGKFSAGTRIFDAVVVPALLYGASAWGRRALSNEGIRQLRSLHYNFAKRVLRGGPRTPTVSAISITGSPPLDIIVRSRTAFLKEINEGNFESRPGPASLPYPPDRRQLSFSQSIEEITTPIIYTDGSKNEAGVGAAIVPSSEDQQTVLLRLHPDCSAFQAELLAIRWAVRLVEEGYSREEITIASDCKSALSAICTSGPVRSTLVAEIVLALNTNQKVKLCWVPGHCGIDGNERADRAAKNAAVSTLEPTFSILLRSLARNHSRTAALDAWTEVYCRDHSNRHLRRIAHTPDRLLQFLPKVRPGEVTTTLLTGHGHVRADLVLWQPGEDPSCPHCMEEQQTVDHLLFRCPAFMRHRMQTALLLGRTSFDTVSLAGLPDSLQAWNFLTSWFGPAIGLV
ncbi:hypothetical protein LAZ67_5001897 [Cordylochernes scorpioides]|uniref:Uncharacterized protein n=1 Tax=Cordylochernes scorpioides TaxID=51811 RepID=A0ABY6KFW2_9ARAC|nr:hypothetical protein LAZ67_5001897 [Cordylochernes scorpioides]